MIPVLILAAGRSHRMRGADKLMEDVGGRTLLRRQIDIASPIGPVFVALPQADHPRLTALVGTKAAALVVPQSAEGMGATLRGAVPHLPDGPFMLLLGDLIELYTSDLRDVFYAMHEHKDHLIWRVATPDGKAGHPVIFAESLRGEFARLNGDEGVKSHHDKTFLHRFNDNRARQDLDTPEDFDAWRMTS